MPQSDQPRWAARRGAALPPTAPLPATLQTVACRWWPLSYFERCRARYGRRFTIRPLDMPPLVFLADPEEIRAVLGAPPTVLHAGAGGELVTPLFGEESFTLLEGEEHMRAREALQPAFGRRTTGEHEELVVGLVAAEVASWPRGEAFAACPRLRALALRVVMRVVLGCEDTAFEWLHGQLLRMLAVMASPLLQEPRLRHLPGWHGQWRRFLRRREEVDRAIFALIARRRQAADTGDGALDRLLAAPGADGSPMSDRQVRDHLVSLLIAGHETVAAQLAWALQLLAHNPTVQARLCEELDGEGGEAYLTATIHEVMRHRPVFPFAAPRAVLAPVEIGGFAYRPPVRLIACVYLLHHDPELYPDPYAFRPERFLGAPPRPRIWLPWGGGRKRCLGQHLALLEMRAVLRAILTTASVLPASDRPERARWRTVMVTPHAGARVVLSPRRRPVRRPRRARKNAHIPV